jgi:hypothetical protein
MNDKDQLLLRKAGFDDLPSALAAIEAMSIEVHQLLNEVNTIRKERDEKYQRFVKFFAEELGDIR